MTKQKTTKPKPKATEIKQAITSEMAADAWSEVERELVKVQERLATAVPAHLFQEKFTTGWLWNKRTYYRYYRYFEGSMVAVGTYSQKTINDYEKIS